VSRSRILIVDDDPLIVRMLSDVLTDEGYEVTTATQSLRAFDRAKESQPDLILMDIMMPYLDGQDQRPGWDRRPTRPAHRGLPV
jgi:CheY-like chemotaxis protein